VTNPKYQVSDQVKRVMAGTAISMDDLEVMVTRAARISHPQGNRRYHTWLLHVDGTKVMLLRKLQMTDYSQGAASVDEECEECWGDGCAECGWIGYVKRLK
jgi:hypothetical protein